MYINLGAGTVLAPKASSTALIHEYFLMHTDLGRYGSWQGTAYKSLF